MKGDNSALITNINTAEKFHASKTKNVGPKLMENLKRRIHRGSETGSRQTEAVRGNENRSSEMACVGDASASSGCAARRGQGGQEASAVDGETSERVVDGVFRVTRARVIPACNEHAMRFESALAHKEALGKFLKELCDEDEDKEAKRKEIIKKRYDLKGRDGKEILSKEFGKDGVKLKMKVQEDDDKDEVKRARKVSFKVNNHHRKKPVESRVVINSNVASLASKYNSLAGDDVLLKNKDVKVIVSRRNSSRKDGGNVSVTYRPSILKSRITNVKAVVGLFEGGAKPKECAVTFGEVKSEVVGKCVDDDELKKGGVGAVKLSETVCKPGGAVTFSEKLRENLAGNCDRTKSRKENPGVLSLNGVESNGKSGKVGVSNKSEAGNATTNAKNVLTTSAKPNRVDNAQIASKKVTPNVAVAKIKQEQSKEQSKPVKSALKPLGKLEVEVKEAKSCPVNEGNSKITKVSEEKTKVGAKTSVKVGPKPKTTADVETATKNDANVIGVPLSANKSSLFSQKLGCKPEIRAKPNNLDIVRRTKPNNLDIVKRAAAKILPNKSNLFKEHIIESVPKIPLEISTLPVNIDVQTEPEPKELERDASANDISDYEVIYNKDSKIEAEITEIKPNTSFLWGSKDANTKIIKRQTLALPKIVDIELTSDQEDSYEIALKQINQKATNTRNQTTDDIELTSDQEDLYDDIHPQEQLPTTPNHQITLTKIELIDQEAPYDDIQAPVYNPSLHYSHLEEIYDDVGNIDESQLAQMGYDYVSSRPHDEDNIYDDVRPAPGKEDTVSLAVSNCYESIYDGRGKASSGSSSDGKSFLEVDNSLYGGARSDSRSASQASTASVEGESLHDVGGYQTGQPRSDTSDEWMDLEMSDSEMEAGTFNVVVHDRRSRCKRSPSWSQRVRRQWSSSRKSPRRRDCHGESSESGSDHHYEMVVGPKSDDIPFDDFDSLDSDDDIKPTPPLPGGYNGRLPDPPIPQSIYGISKMAEAAGNRLLKFSKSLSRMRPKRHTTEVRFNPPAADPAGPPALSLPPLPPTPPEKSPSPRALPNRKYWSLRKFRRNTSVPAMETSTFYLTDAVDVDAKATKEANNERTRASTPPMDRRITIATDLGSEIAATFGKQAPGERKSSARPNSPPPLPPLPPEVPKRPNRKDKRATTSNTSWYAECGLFDTNDSAESKRLAAKDRPLSDSWYADVGLWDKPGSGSPKGSLGTCSPMSEASAGRSPTASVRSRSDSSLATEGTESERRFRDEPLYQFYTETVLERARRVMNAEFDSDGYEEVDSASATRPSAMDLIPRHGQHRSLWCEIPEVINSCVLSTLSTHQKKLQEAKFEILSSEASYIKSLNVLEEHFISSTEFNDDAVLSKSDRRVLFSNVAPVRLVSRKLLAELERCWQHDILLHDICDVVYRHATEGFNAYVKYCSNQIYLDRTLRRLKDQRGRFAAALTSLETFETCESLSLHSFLMLPMQRVTRLPLLLDAVLTRLSRQDAEYDSCTLALATLNKVVQQCNEAARQMERMEEILILSHQLEFPKDIKAIPIISSSRWLVRSGELTQLVVRGDEAKLTFGRKFSKTTLYVFLFTDLLVVTKKKSDDSYTVLDYCPRNLVQMTSSEGLSQLPVKALADGGKNLVLLTLLSNHEHKTVEMMLSCGVESDRQRWLQAVSQPTAANPEESVYEHWDCPQVSALHSFAAAQPDELALAVADVVNVLRKTPDGWYYGQRIRDGEQGWFPGNHTAEVASAHVRAKNLKQRYRLLALSGNFLDAQRKDKK